MEAVLMNNNTSGDYNRRICNPKRNFVTNRSSLYSYRSDDLLLASFIAGGHFAGGGLYSTPPHSLYNSFPAAGNLQHHRQLPPLLPLPISMPLNFQNVNMNNTNINRSTSSCNNKIRSSPPRINKNVKNRGRDHSLTPKKSKNQKKNLKREEVDTDPDLDLVPPVPESEIEQMIGPDPKDLPKDVISRAFSINKSCDVVSVDVVDKFSGSVVFTPSPPPSSLPLPTFSLRPKLSCKAEAAVAASGVDAGATDSLRRLLRL